MVTDSQVAKFHISLTEYGYADVKTAIEKFKEVGMSPGDLGYEIMEFHESTGISIQDIDVCYVAFDHILQMARKKIDEVLDFDICDDIKNSTGFYTCENSICTSFASSQKATDELEWKLEDAVMEQIDELLDDIFVKVFLKDVGMNIKEIRKTVYQRNERLQTRRKRYCLSNLTFYSSISEARGCGLGVKWTASPSHFLQLHQRNERLQTSSKRGHMMNCENSNSESRVNLQNSTSSANLSVVVENKL